MRLTEKQVNDRIERTEDSLDVYRKLADRWERMWSLNVFNTSNRQSIEQDGMEQVVLPTPYNVVNLGMRLIAPVPKIIVPSKASDGESEDFAQVRQNWLQQMWQHVRRENGMSPIDNAAWQAMVRGRMAFDVRWVKKDLPKGMKGRFPILIRNLDPKNVGVARGPLYTEHAYHRYECTMWEVIQRYPDLKRKRVVTKYKHNSEDDWLDETVMLTDFWYRSEGDIWNAVLIEDEFAKKPYKTQYPEIPIIMGYADTSMSTHEEYRSLSILHPMDGLWQYQCRAMSQMATGMLWYFWPFIYATNETGQVISDLRIRPGDVEQFPEGTKINVVSIQPNMPLAQAIMNQVDSHLQQSSFPGVLYGEAPGDLQAGYGVNLLSDAAKGRMRSIIANLEICIMQVNRVVLGLVDTFVGPDGIDVWGKSEETNKPARATLHKETLEDGYYENQVQLKPQLPEDDNQKLAMGMQMVNAKIMSARTFRDTWMGMPLPDDEEERIYLEQAQQSDMLMPKTFVAALKAWYGDQAEEIVRGTPLEQVLNPPEPQPMEMPGPPGPLGMPGPMPPGGPMGGPPGMPPGPVPGGPLTGGGAPMQPPAIPGPMGGGLPPELQGGQLTPEMLGIIRQQNPLLFAQLTGQPLPPQEELALAGGLPPGVLR